jgi:thioredoxin 1
MEITALELQEKINKGEKIIIEFWATWCGPCKLMKPVFDRVASSNTSSTQMYTMNIEENKDFAIQMGIRSIPTVKVFNNGELTDTKVGVLNESQIKSLIN